MAKSDKTVSDKKTYAPFELIDCRATEWKDVRLSFNDWEWLAKLLKGEVGEVYVDDYYLNGYGVQGLVQACRLQAGLEVEKDGIDYDSEADTCLIHFTELETAEETARLSSAMIKDPKKIAKMVKLARENDLED